jgi:hypothetical protein
LWKKRDVHELVTLKWMTLKPPKTFEDFEEEVATRKSLRTKQVEGIGMCRCQKE